MKISQPAHEMSHHIMLAHVTIIICVCVLYVRKFVAALLQFGFCVCCYCLGQIAES